jgi:predicted RecB family nuclease
VEARLAALSGQLEQMHALVARDAAPAREPGRHCGNPFECEFWEHCTRDKPRDWIHYLPNLRATQRETLRRAGHERISLLPEDVALTPLQARVRDALRSGRPVVSGSLGEALRKLTPPVWYLDFETVNPAIPLYAGTSPFEVIPFQWSLHRLEPDGELSHHEFLASGEENPRRACAESLTAALAADDAPVAVYTRFERTQIKGLMRAFPDLADALHAIAERLVDVHGLARAHVYHPDFCGSFSIKKVAPALAPGFGYGDLDAVAEGNAASAAFLRLARGELEPSEAQRMRKALLAYCERDTLALVEVHRALRALADGAQALI